MPYHYGHIQCMVVPPLPHPSPAILGHKIMNTKRMIFRYDEKEDEMSDSGNFWDLRV